ncbi:pyocin activator PrtN family protein [Pigmentiphaga sp. CHJ604]|uniref:pyocin activator PrtN family protein n=1 Tax=Pigmentiphaga sp. CHJ604 TaxID=3081984 RepID=UPI0030CC0E25
MNTAFLLMAQYGAKAIIPLDVVARDYFDLAPEKLQRKINAGDIALPLVRMEGTSQKTARGVHIDDLARYIDARAEAARKECQQLNE